MALDEGELVAPHSFELLVIVIARIRPGEEESSLGARESEVELDGEL